MTRIASPTTRRRFLSTSSASASAMLATQLGSAAAADDVPILKIGLIGCGGRGTGAAIEALRADRRVELTAMGDPRR